MGDPPGGDPAEFNHDGAPAANQTSGRARGAHRKRGTEGQNERGWAHFDAGSVAHQMVARVGAGVASDDGGYDVQRRPEYGMDEFDDAGHGKASRRRRWAPGSSRIMMRCSGMVCVCGGCGSELQVRQQ